MTSLGVREMGTADGFIGRAWSLVGTIIQTPISSWRARTTGVVRWSRWGSSGGRGLPFLATLGPTEHGIDLIPSAGFRVGLGRGRLFLSITVLRADKSSLDTKLELGFGSTV